MYDKIIHTILICTCIFSLNLFCLKLPPARTQGSGIRLFFGPAYGFYQINTNHAKSAIPKKSGCVGFRKEIRADRDFKAFFLIGADYFFHGLSFKTYYFKPDSIKLYDKTFAYDYSLFMHEINIPIQVKYSFTRENNSISSPYFMIGYHLRYLLPGTLNVSQNGDAVKKERLDVIFKNPLIYNKINSFISITSGWQKNSLNSSKISFFVELNLRYGFSPYYFEKEYSPSSLNFNSTHLSLFLGLKF